MAQDDSLICHCFECQGELHFSADGLGETIECPICHQETILYDSRDEGEPMPNPEIKSQVSKTNSSPPPSNSPSLKSCKTCNGAVAESSQVCIHCGQLWPTINLECGNCGANNFDFEIYEDNSSVWITPSIAGVLSAAIWELMRSKPRCAVRCLNCGGLFERPPGV